MEGSNVARYMRGDSRYVYSLVSELRTPLLELRLKSEINGDIESLEIAKQALRLFDGFLYMNEARLQSDQLSMIPCSLGAETIDAVRSIEDFAELYGIKINLKVARVNKPVSLNRVAYRHATHGLLYAAVTSLQNTEGSSIDVSVSGGASPKLQVWSKSFTKQAFNGTKTKIDLRKVSLPHFDGIGSGITLAEEIYELLDSEMVWTGRDSFYATFKKTTQLSLLGA